MGNPHDICQMAADTKVFKRTPIVEVRWCKLLGPARDCYDKDKGREWSIELVLDNNNAEHMAWVEQVEAEFVEAHGEGVKKSVHWCPVKPEKDEPRKKMSCRMKLKEWYNERNNSYSAGPQVFSGLEGEEGQMWPATKLIGNGSKCRLSYTIYPWGKTSKTGAGISLEVQGCQVMEWLAAPEKIQATAASDHGFTSTPEADAAARAAYTAPSAPVAEEPAATTEDDDDIPF